MGTPQKESQTKLNTVPQEEEELVEHELRMQIEEEKYKLYIGQLSPEESDTDMEMNGSHYPFLE